MSINRHELPDSRDIYTSDDLSPEDLRVLYLASLTDADREGAALTEDDVFDWLDKLAGDNVAVFRNEQRRIMGMIAYNLTAERLWVSHLAVDPGERRSGKGRELLAHAEQQAGDRPIMGRATPTSETYYTHLGYNVDDKRNVSA